MGSALVYYLHREIFDWLYLASEQNNLVGHVELLMNKISIICNCIMDNIINMLVAEAHPWSGGTHHHLFRIEIDISSYSIMYTHSFLTVAIHPSTAPSTIMPTVFLVLIT